MPRGDGTGPRGIGPMTGRAAGFCVNTGMPGYANTWPGRGGMGFGRGFGGNRGFGGAGRGRRFMGNNMGSQGYMQPVIPNPDIEKQALRNQADQLQAELDLIKKRLTEIETGTSQES